MLTETLKALGRKYKSLKRVMDERLTRLWAAAEAEALGRGGIAAVHEATGLSRARIQRGQVELKGLRRTGKAATKAALSEGRIRRAGAGRKRLVDASPELLTALEALVEPTTRGDPESPLRWTTKSTARLADELKKQGHSASASTVGRLLHGLEYSLQGNSKQTEGKQHPDRDAQFQYINATAAEFLDRGQPVVSVDTKKKELVGDFANKGREWQPAGEPELVRTYDFVDKTLGKAIPYGVYDIVRNEAYVNVGIDHDTAQFSVQSIRQWWMTMGIKAYQKATELLITADGGGSNGSRLRLWKLELQKLADETGLTIAVSHFPPGTSKWNKIEHRLFSQISQNWRGRPLVSHETIVNVIASTRTKTGLRVRAKLDARTYPKGIKVPDADMATLALERNAFHGDWNYKLLPRT